MVAALQVAICIGQLGRGGSEKQLIGFLNGIDRQLIEPQIWVFNSGGAWEEPLRELGVKVIDFSAWPKLTRAFNVWRFSLRQRLDVWWSWSYYTNFYANFVPLSIPRIGSIRSSLWYAREVVGFLYPMCERNLQLMVANSSATISELHLDQYAADCTWVGNAINCSDVYSSAMRQKWRIAHGLSLQTRLVVGVGRLDANKNFSALIKAFANLPLDESKLLIAGDGPQRKDLEQHIIKLGLSKKVELLGVIADANDLIAAADVLVHPSLSEGMPNVVMEAIAARVPVVATLVNGIKDLLPPDNEGWVVPQSDLYALRAAILEAILEPVKAQRRVNRAFERLHQLFNSERVAQFLQAWLFYVVHRGEKPPEFDVEPGR